MAAPSTPDPRAARWEARFRTPIIVAKAFKTLKLAKAIKLAKLGKSVRVLRRKLALSGAVSVALGVVALLLAAATVAYMLTGEAPWHGDRRTIAFVVAGMLATYGVNHLVGLATRR